MSAMHSLRTWKPALCVVPAVVSKRERKLIFGDNYLIIENIFSISL